jgi:hypothetical protein
MFWKLICRLIGHKWQDEKEFVSCCRCHRIESKREQSRQPSGMAEE